MFMIVLKFIFDFFFISVNQFLFISGPVVVKPQEMIQFMTIYPANSNIQAAKWTKIQNNETKEICIGASGITLQTPNTNPSLPSPQFLKISKAKENVGTYQLCWNNLKSNKITIFTDGMCSCIYVLFVKSLFSKLFFISMSYLHFVTYSFFFIFVSLSFTQLPTLLSFTIQLCFDLSDLIINLYVHSNTHGAPPSQAMVRGLSPPTRGCLSA